MHASDGVSKYFILYHGGGMNFCGFKDAAELAEYAMILHASKGLDVAEARLEVINRLIQRDKEERELENE